VDAVRIECLGCGEARGMDAHAHRLDPGECPRCGYLGWAPSTALTEPMRRRIRERPVDRRAAIYAV
jgi:ribosomal protein S27AE